MKNTLMKKIQRFILFCSISSIVVSAPALAAGVSKFGFEDSSNVALVYFRGSNISFFALSFPLTCSSSDTPGEYTPTFTSSAFVGTGGLNRDKRLSATLQFEDSSGRSITVVARGNFSSRRPIIRLEVTPAPSDIETCQPFLVSYPLKKLRG